MTTTTQYITGTHFFLDHLNHLDTNTNKNSKCKHKTTITESKVLCIYLKGVCSNNSILLRE